MKGRDLRTARLTQRLSQVDAAARLGVSQSYLAMLERGQRRLSARVAVRAAKVYGLAPTAVPRSRPGLPTRAGAAALARDAAGLGYPGFAYLRSPRWTPRNPGEVLLAALAQEDLEPRLVEALPWLVLRYSSLDWGWVVREAKLHDLQNRLGFVVALARQVATRLGDDARALPLRDLEAQLERSRLAREDTLCQAGMPAAERRWLLEQRPDAARHWNLLTDWTADALRYPA
jgi:transcriptional regulator with XRE-family HTH domain